MGAPSPSDIWEESLDEGERRLDRGAPQLAATGLVGGFDVMFGLLLVALVTGAVNEVAPERLSHIVGSLFFGVAFVLITMGRSELFTENFLLPVGALLRDRQHPGRLVRLWSVTLLFNVLGLLALAAVFTVDGVLEPSTLKEAGVLADKVADRDVWPAFWSAVVAGTAMTLFTWLNAAADTQMLVRVAISYMIGFLLLAPMLNHAVVGAGEMLFGMLANTSHASVTDLFQNLGIATLGNFLGGLFFVTITRLIQAKDED